MTAPPPRPGIPGPPLGAPPSRRPRAKRDIAPPPSPPPGVPEFPEPVPDRRRRARALVVALALLAASATGPAAAEGGSFTLCYERLKQLAALYAAQGAEVSEPVDDPGTRRYEIELRIAGAVRRLACGPDGRIERPAEEE